MACCLVARGRAVHADEDPPEDGLRTCAGGYSSAGVDHGGHRAPPFWPDAGGDPSIAGGLELLVASRPSSTTSTLSRASARLRRPADSRGGGGGGGEGRGGEARARRRRSRRCRPASTREGGGGGGRGVGEEGGEGGRRRERRGGGGAGGRRRGRDAPEKSGECTAYRAREFRVRNIIRTERRDSDTRELFGGLLLSLTSMMSSRSDRGTRADEDCGFSKRRSAFGEERCGA